LIKHIQVPAQLILRVDIAAVPDEVRGVVAIFHDLHTG
jgi:hypothetical protein